MNARDDGDAAPARRPLVALVGVAAIVAPTLHTLSDVVEWMQGGYSAPQLWLNYAAFVVLPWVLPGLWAVHRPRPGGIGLAGALLYGIAFAYFAHTTLVALDENLPNYAALWRRLGAVYTLHGALMIGGGTLFAIALLRAGTRWRGAVGLFLAGLATNLVLALLPVPDLWQVAGTALRNLGLVAMGWHALRGVSSR